MGVLTLVLSALLALAMIQSTVRKAVHSRDSDELRDRLLIGNRLWQFTGVLEAAAGMGLIIGIWWRPVGVAAAVGVVLVMVGAVVAHARLGLVGPRELAPPIGLLGLAGSVAALVAAA